MLGNNIMESDVAVIKQLIDLYEENGASNIAVIELSKEDTNKYSIIVIDQAVDFSGEIISLLNVVEKTNETVAPNNLAVAGRYVLTPQIFDILANQPPGNDDEI